MAYHKPVLLHESVEGLNIQPKGIYVDLTFGGGGHALEVLNKLGKKGRLIAFDQDPDAAANIPDDRRVTFIQANFRYLKNFLRYYQVDRVDGILADLGISSHQIDVPGRGFSFREESALDMRMDPAASQSAADVLNGYSPEALTRIFRNFGEIRSTGRLVDVVVRYRRKHALSKVSDLEAALGDLIPDKTPSKYLARIYQALRIEVNQELQALEEMLLQTTEYIKPSGRLVIITYHSLEDRLVKNFLRSGNLEGRIEKDFFGHERTPWRLVNRKVITPSPDEISQNSRSRSAKLRIAERKANEQGAPKY